MAKLYYQGHGSYRITTSDGRVIYIDPFAGRGYEPKADIVLITHKHRDHNKLSLVTQKNNCRVITNEQALEGGRHNKFTIDGIEIQAVIAKNFMHSPKKCVGYLIFVDGVKLYVSGDTSKYEQMKEFAELELDYAIFCADGKFNMGLKEAADCAELIGARHNIPVHLAPGRLFDKKRAGWWQRNALNPLIITPGGEIELLSAQDEAYAGVYMNEKVLNYVYDSNELHVTTTQGAYVLTKKDLGSLSLPTGMIVANDPCAFFEADEFTIVVKPGSYPVSIFITRSSSGDRRVALAMIELSGKKAVKWELALVNGQSTDNLKGDDYFGYGVDSGTGGFMDKRTADQLNERGLDVYELFRTQFDATYVHTYNYAIGSIDGGKRNDIVAFSSGWGDGCYPSYFGFDETGEPCSLVTDFLILD